MTARKKTAKPSAPTSAIEPKLKITPTPPIEIGGDPDAVSSHFAAALVDVDDALVSRLESICPVSTDISARAEAGRDWWPLALRWSLDGAVPAVPGALVSPSSAAEVAAVLSACNETQVPVTPMAGRSGVCGSSVPVHGGVALDMNAMAGLVEVDETALIARLLPGTFGPDVEILLRGKGVTLGHWPQSMAISTLGGWIACRGAGQYSTRYGKIEDMVLGLEVALADGRIIRTGGTSPRAAMGPDLTQIFIGSEGTLGVITEATVQVHLVPPTERRLAFGFPSFEAGLDACRRILRSGGTPAVLRLYDAIETKRNFELEGTNVLIVLDEGDDVATVAAMAITARECADATLLDTFLVDTWLKHRNDTSKLQELTRLDVVVDTIEVAGSWSALGGIYSEAIAGLRAVEGNLNASAHQSHAYPTGACIYFTFAGRHPEGIADTDTWAENFYVASWNAVMDTVMAHGGAISHHHGIGINRGRFMAPALGESFGVLTSIKGVLDPNGILNPGKLGLASPFGSPVWP